MNRRRVVCAATVLSLVVAAGCSNDGDDNSASADRATSSTSSPTTTDNSVTSTPPTEPGSATSAPGTGVTSNLLPPVAIGQTIELASNFAVTVTSVEPTTFTAQGPGQTSGPGVVAAIELRNDTAETIDLSGLVVNAHYGEGTPAIPNTVMEGAFEGSLAPGETRTGRYGFRVAEGEASSVVFDIQHSGAPNIAVVYVTL